MLHNELSGTYSTQSGLITFHFKYSTVDTSGRKKKGVIQQWDTLQVK